MHKFDFEMRTTEFAIQVVKYCKILPFNTINDQVIRQLVRSAGSVGANYREANDALGTKDIIYRLKIARKEAKETHHWLLILKEANSQSDLAERLIQESDELRKILCSMITKLSIYPSK